MAKKKETKAFQRLMNVLMIAVGFITLLILSNPPITISNIIILREVKANIGNLF